MKDLLKTLESGGTSRKRVPIVSGKQPSVSEDEVELSEVGIDSAAMDVDSAPSVPVRKRPREVAVRSSLPGHTGSTAAHSESGADEPLSKRQKSGKEAAAQAVGANLLLPPAPMAAPAPRPLVSTAPRTPLRSRSIQPSSPAKRRLFDSPNFSDASSEILPLAPLKPHTNLLPPAPLSGSAQPLAPPSKSLQPPSSVAAPTPLSPRKASQDIKEKLGSDYWLPLPEKYSAIEESFKYPFKHLLLAHYLRCNTSPFP